MTLECLRHRAVAVLLAVSSMHAEEVELTYPPTRHAEQVDDYHGVQVADPFRWLEDENSAETRAWIAAQNKVTFGFLETISERAAIKARLTALWNYERFGVPWREGGRIFFTHNSGLQNQRVLLVADSADVEPRLLLDPNKLSADGTVAMTDFVPSRDGRRLVYGLQRAGSDWEEFHVRDVETGRDLDDTIEWVKFSGASWAADGSGFFYSRYDAPKPGAQLTQKNEFQKLCFHRIGARQSEDTLIYERRDHADWGFEGRVTEDGRYLVIGVWQGTDPKNRVFFKDLAEPKGKVVELLNDFDASYSFIDNDGTVFFFNTDLAAPRSRVIAIDIARPQRARWREIVPQAAEPLKGASVVHGRFLCQYLQDAHSQVKIFAWDGSTRAAKCVSEIVLPGLGTASGFGGKRADTDTFYSFTSFTAPGTIYRLDLATGESTVFRAPKVDFQPADYETRQVFFRGKDGARVPMFLAHRRGLALDGSHPTLLYGYGGFNISLTPAFNVTALVWMERGGVYAMPNLRGGGEYGRDWHLAGMKEKKQNVFDDFIAAAEWLVAEKFTSPAKLAIKGGSNGGLLVGACMTQRPELFGAALPSVGVMDMLRFQRFTIGWAWKSEYGSSEDAADFRTLHAYSPLHRLRPGVRYPATLIATADHDDRVVPAHSFKFAARLQECQPADGPPVLLRVETQAGHGSGTPLSKTIEETADELGFLCRVLGRSAH